MGLAMVHLWGLGSKEGLHFSTNQRQRSCVGTNKSLALRPGNLPARRRTQRPAWHSKWAPPFLIPKSKSKTIEWLCRWRYKAYGAIGFTYSDSGSVCQWDSMVALADDALLKLECGNLNSATRVTAFHCAPFSEATISLAQQALCAPKSGQNWLPQWGSLDR